jgi:hypothetical protein
MPGGIGGAALWVVVAPTGSRRGIVGGVRSLLLRSYGGVAVVLWVEGEVATRAGGGTEVGHCWEVLMRGLLKDFWQTFQVVRYM